MINFKVVIINTGNLKEILVPIPVLDLKKGMARAGLNWTIARGLYASGCVINILIFFFKKNPSGQALFLHAALI